MDFTFTTGIYTAVYFVLIILSIEAGRLIARRFFTHDPDLAGTGTIDAALFAILGLLIAFTFSGAAERFDERRKLIVQETNMIGTAYLRIDLLPAESRPAIKQKFRDYLDSRIRAYENADDTAAFIAEREVYMRLQNEIWNASVEAARGSEWAPAAMLLMPALNEMIDITTTRNMARRMHPPQVIYVMLILISFVAAVLSGFASAAAPKRSWVHITAFSVTLAVIFFVVLDLEMPRLGLITVDSFDKALVDLRRTMN